MDTKNCGQCGKLLDVKKSSHKYCSDKCRYRARKQRDREGIEAPTSGGLQDALTALGFDWDDYHRRIASGGLDALEAQRDCIAAMQQVVEAPTAASQLQAQMSIVLAKIREHNAQAAEAVGSTALDSTPLTPLEQMGYEAMLPVGLIGWPTYAELPITRGEHRALESLFRRVEVWRLGSDD